MVQQKAAPLGEQLFVFEGVLIKKQNFSLAGCYLFLSLPG
jgi:hypothetical protein